MWTESNLGAPTGKVNGCFVVDIDGDEGRSSLSKYPKFDITPSVLTGRDGGGQQIYLKYPEGITIKDRIAFLPGIDIRSDGGQVILPPSTHYTGRQYKWLYPFDDVPLAECPKWLLDLFQQAQKADDEIAKRHAAVKLNNLGKITQADLDAAGKEANGFLKACDNLEWYSYPSWRSKAVWANALDRAFSTSRFYERFCEASRRHAKYRQKDEVALDRHFKGLDDVTLAFEGLGLQYDTKTKQAIDPNASPWPGIDFTGFNGTKATTTHDTAIYNEVESPLEPEPEAPDNSQDTGAEPEVEPEQDPEPEVKESILNKLFWHADELKNQPLPEWLDKPLLVRNSIAFIVGDTGTYKSFFAVDRSLTIAQTEKVAYIAGEGHYATRVEAWRIYNQKSLGEAYFSKRSLQPANLEQLPYIIQAMKELMPSLIVIDTLNRAAIGLNENDQGDMGLFIDAITQIREATGACILIIHHTNRGGSERGSSAIKDGADTFIKFTKEGDLVKVTCEKHKDRKDFEPFYIETELVTIPEMIYDDGETADSLVIKRAENPIETNRGGRVSGNMRLVLETLALEVFRETGATAKKLLDSLQWETGGKRSEMYKILSRLMESGYVTQDKKGEPFRVTQAGLDIVSSQPL
jgi:hypothetical protein